MVQTLSLWRIMKRHNHKAEYSRWTEEVAMGWYNYLDEQLGFPFVATCSKALEVSPLKKGEEVTVTGMGDMNYCTSTMLVQIKAWEQATMDSIIPASMVISLSASWRRSGTGYSGRLADGNAGQY